MQAQEVLAPRPRRMVRRTSVLGLVEERLHDLVEKLDELSLSMSMPSSTTDNEKLVAAELNLPSIATGSSSNYTAAELKQFQERFEKTSLGAVILAGMAATASSSLGGAAAAAAGGSTSSNSKKSDKTGIVCTDRLEMVKAEVELNFGLEVTDEDITAACSFANEIDSPFTAEYFPNLSCPVKAYPFSELAIFVDGGFLMNDVLYEEFYGTPLGRALWLHHKYCECHQGYELGCAAKIPYPEESSGSALRSLFSAFLTDGELFGLGSNVQPGDSPKKWQEYCKFAAVWNGDISYERYDDIGLNPEVKECGCFFVGSARKNVAGCPDVDLYAHFPTD